MLETVTRFQNFSLLKAYFGTKCWLEAADKFIFAAN